MKPPRFKLSTLCLIVALVALVLGYGWQAIENNRLRVLETTHAEAVMVRDQMANALAESQRRVEESRERAAAHEVPVGDADRTKDER
jgi:hypothetical protein